ncbi:MAG: succinyldiaminopimelate transaminase [Gammaproteobacteria bacterium]|nr:MAG: succinyldiaminopimelate transaminase [Gammaproteobacteria bacterium]RKZ71734.1 MAG: succinyldiaminopimelate transaminase [Gammaproteobacteria bacterium]
MNPGLEKLHPYPFEKLTQLKQTIVQDTSVITDKAHIDLSIGEPKHTTPGLILDELQKQLPKAASYPTTRGIDELRQAIADWLVNRFNLSAGSITAEQNILPVNGTREALFAFAQCVINSSATDTPVVISPNPFYQIYEGAALLASAEPYYINCVEDNKFLPDFNVVPEDIWQRCQLVYLCSPGNPTGAVLGQDAIEKLLNLADKHDFIIAADECYSEIYFDEASPPIGLLQAAANLGRDDFKRCVVFHSLSKRSNVPGMRSGFIAGDAELIQTFLRYRTYHGSAMPIYTQMASIVAWQDEDHVLANRDLYRQKFDAVLDILKPVMNVSRPDASFYLWPETPISDTEFAAGLYSQQNITVLPGSFLSRSIAAGNPGKNRIRIALVPEIDQCIEAANRICTFIKSI